MKNRRKKHRLQFVVLVCIFILASVLCLSGCREGTVETAAPGTTAATTTAPTTAPTAVTTVPTTAPVVPITAEDVAGKTFVYEKTGFGGEFIVSVYANGTFLYYEGQESNCIRGGKWTISDNLLWLVANEKTYVFSVCEDALIFQAAQSDAFAYVDVTQGDRFHAAEVSIPVQSLQYNLVWAEVKKIENTHMYVADNRGNHWKVLLKEAPNEDLRALRFCWVGYYGEPVEIQEVFGKDTAVQRQIVAEKCWRLIDNVPGAGTLGLGTYDYCQYDIDNDGILETCVLSRGYTSGISSFILSVWEDGVCVLEQWVYQDHASFGMVFLATDGSLRAMSSGSRIYSISWVDGTLCVTQEDFP